MALSRAVRAAAAGLLTATAAGAGDPPAPERWATFAPPEGDFRVELPASPRHESQEHWTPLGVVRESRYWLSFGDAELSIETHDVPALPARWMGHERVLERAREGVLEHVDGTVLESRELTFAGLPAREFVYRSPSEPQRVERVLTVLVGSRLFLVAGASAGPGPDPAVSRFFDSFRLVPAVAAGPE